MFQAQQVLQSPIAEIKPEQYQLALLNILIVCRARPCNMRLLKIDPRHTLQKVLGLKMNDDDVDSIDAVCSLVDLLNTLFWNFLSSIPKNEYVTSVAGAGKTCT